MRNCSALRTQLGDSTLGAVTYCAQSCAQGMQCSGICVDPDMTGVGVRIGFYLQALTNGMPRLLRSRASLKIVVVLLVVFATDVKDSASGSWSGSVLTAALVIPAMWQKFHQNITLHDAVLVLNFATLSCVASIAVAPMCDIWWQPWKNPSTRSSSASSHPKTDIPDVVSVTHPQANPSIRIDQSHVADGMLNASEGSSRFPSAAELTSSPEQHHKPLTDEPSDPPPDPAVLERMKRREATIANVTHFPEHHRTATSRAVLSVSLLTQILLQWVWALAMFVSPVYSQPWCSGETVLMMFLIPVEVGKVHGGTDAPGSSGTYSIVIWPFWLASCLFVSSFYGVLLVLRATEYAAAEHRVHPSTQKGLRHISSNISGRRKREPWLPFPPIRTSRGRSSRRASIGSRASATGNPRELTRLQYWANYVAQDIQNATLWVGKWAAYLYPPVRDKRGTERPEQYNARLRIWIANAIASLIVIILIISSELQLRYNCTIHTGSPWAFGQVSVLAQ
ncbi:hypothetical protein DL93DRAFT_922422 [Clavulina sp. PMI_390]|nr:hypothetical protein DL93DRAFT_922422 [Clavulina sp. PMI_390]